MEDSYEIIKKLIDNDQIEKAMEVLVRLSNKEPLMQNARAVCAMRTDFPEDAVDLLTPLVTEETVNDPAILDKIKLNLAEALLLTGNIPHAINLIEQTAKENTYRQSILAILQEWKRSLPLRARLGIHFGLFPIDKPVPVNYPYGRA